MINKRLTEWMNEYMSERANECMNQWIPYKMMVKPQIENAKKCPVSLPLCVHFLTFSGN